MAIVLFGVLFTPFYIRFLGIEAYGLIGFYITLQSSLGFLELGLSRACNREMAKLTSDKMHDLKAMGETLRTFEGLYWMKALLIYSGISLLSSYISRDWLQSDFYTPEELKSIIGVMALVIAIRWPKGVYRGALMGLEKHVYLNIITVFSALLIHGGAVLVLWLYEPSIIAYFKWQVISQSISILLFIATTWYFTNAPFIFSKFRVSVLSKVLKFISGVGGNAIIGTILRQGDKIILSTLLPLKEYSYYMIASLMAGLLSVGANIVSSAVFPKFTKLVANGESEHVISKLYHESCQFINAFTTPLAIVFIIFPVDIIQLYTGDPEVALNTKWILIILVISKYLHSNMIIPYALQLAYGWLKLSVFMNIISLIYLIPALWLLTDYFGAIGSATAWLFVTIGYVFVVLPLMHKKLLRGQYLSWLKNSILILFLIIFPFVTICYFIINITKSNPLLTTIWIGFVLGSSVVISLLLYRTFREYIFKFIKRNLIF